MIIRLLMLLVFCNACAQSSTHIERSGQGKMLQDGRYSEIGEVPVSALEPFTPVLPERHILSNGMVVLLMPDSERPIVEMSLTVRVGSWNDPPGLSGLAACTAEVLRKGGSEGVDGDLLDSALDALGASIAVTCEDEVTTLTTQCLAEDQARVLSLLTELVHAPAFPQEVLERVKGQLLASVASRNDSARDAANRESKRAFYGPDDPRVRRMERETVASIVHEDVVVFHRDHYGSRKSVLTVYGDFEQATMLAALEESWGNWPVQTAPTQKFSVEVPQVEQTHVWMASRPDVNQAEIRILGPGIRRSHPDYPALALGAAIVGSGGFGNRMMNRIRSELGLAYGAGAFWQGSHTQQGLFFSYCATKNATAELATWEMMQVLETFLEDGVGVEEFEAARNRVLNAAVFQVDTRAKVLARIASLELHGYPWNFFEQAQLAIQSLTPNQVMEACRRHLDLDQVQVFVMGNALAFDGDFTSFGSVYPWDLDEPDGGTSTAQWGPEHAEAGRVLGDHVLSSHGGAEAWAFTAAVQAQMQMEDGSTAQAWMVHPHQLRVVQGEGATAIQHYVGETSAWQILDHQAPVMAGEEEWSRAQLDLSQKLPMVLMRLARGAYRLTSTEKNSLELEGEGLNLSIEVGADGLCRSLTALQGETVVGWYSFENYGLSGGLMLPRIVSWGPQPGEIQSTVSFEWQPNPSIPFDWFSPPTQ
ncbi:MAG: insulinase family protein [Planctomycetes bacterium]|nr:insulinase family protein [Planctomycetota bacterium]